MSASKKQIKVGHVQVFDTTLIYSRVLGLQNSRNIDLQHVLEYELSPVPPALFDDNGDMQSAAQKSVLKKKIQVEVSLRSLPPADVIIIDGCAMLWTIAWPTNGIVKDFVANVFARINLYLECDVHLIFDKYFENSVKNATCHSRAGKDASRVYQLAMNTPLPPQKNPSYCDKEQSPNHQSHCFIPA